MSDFDSQPILEFLNSFWRQYYGDLPKLERYWDALSRVFDDEWAQIEQINDASNVSTVPDFIYHTYLNRTLEDWQSYGLPHTHWRKDFRASAAQTVFYLGAWPKTEVSVVFLNGKEVDAVADPYTVTFEQDGTQPGTNPAGARLVFASPLSSGAAVSLFTDKLLARLEVEVPAGGLSSISFPSDVDEATAKVTLKKVNVTRFLTVETGKFSYAVANPNVTDTRIFRRGETFEVIDGAFTQTINVSADTQEVAIPTPVNPLTAVVYKVLDFEITHGKVAMAGDVVRASGQLFPVSSRVRASDGYGSKGVVVEAPTDTVDLGRPFDDPSVFMYDGKIIDGYSEASDEIVFERSFIEGMVILVEAALIEENDHAHHRNVVANLTSEIAVPPTRPWILTAPLLENPNFPIQFFVDGMILHPDQYTFKPGAETYTIVLNSPLVLPSGTVTDVYYVDKEEPQPHKHVMDRFVVGVPTSAFSLSDFIEDKFSQYVNVSGSCLSDPALRRFTPNGEFLNFAMPLTTGTIVKIRGSRTSYWYYHEIDSELVRAEYLQNGIDQQSGAIPAGWTVQLEWGVDFTVADGIVEANTRIEDAWFKDVLIDEETGYTNYGKLIDFYRENSAEYVKILGAIFAGNYMGSQPQTIENFINIILGSDYLLNRSEVTAIGNGTVRTADGREYNLDPEVPVRVRSREEYERFFAVSAFAEILEDLSGIDLIAIMAEEFSPNYRYGKNLDITRPMEYDGGAAVYNRATHKLFDSNVDFFDWEVWPGDLIALYPQWSPTDPHYVRVGTVDRHELGIEIDLGITAIAYGEESYGEYTYGGTSSLEQVDHYHVWSRKTDRLDVYRFLDEALNEEIPYLTERFIDLLGKHVFLVHILWEARRSGQALEDVRNFLDRAKPHDKRYIGYSEVYDDEGLSDEIQGTLTDEEPEREIIPGVIFASHQFNGFAGVRGGTAFNGGFAGFRVVP